MLIINKDILVYILSFALLLCALYIGRHVFLNWKKKSPTKESKTALKSTVEESVLTSKKTIGWKPKSLAISPLTEKEKNSIMHKWVIYIILWMLLIYFWMISEYLYNDLYSDYKLLKVLFAEKIIFFVMWASIIWWVANVFQNIILWNKSANFYNNLLAREHLFSDKTEYNFILRKFLNLSYNKTWYFWTEVQPILSMFVWIIVYFILISWINLSWSIPANPNIFFYSAIAFLSWFFYDKFLDFLHKISSQILNNESYSDRLMNIIDDFDIARKWIITDTRTKETKLAKEVEPTGEETDS